MGPGDVRVAKAGKPRLSPGDVVGGRYRIDGVVGRGGFGAVYRATQLDTQIPVALKVLLKNFSTAQKDYKRFGREAALVQKLQHPNVVQLLDYGQTEKGQPYIAFELLEGTPLRTVLKQSGALPLARAAKVTRDVLAALEAAHAMGVIHRDIKPANVFLCNDGNTKVLDFGIAKAVAGEEAGATQLTEAGQMIGTPQYMAPEQVRGTGAYPATDLYALGLLTAEMVNGTRVVKGAALIDVYMVHISEDPLELGAVLNSPIAKVVERATAKSIEERYKSATEMIRDLELAFPALGGQPLGGATTALSSDELFGSRAPSADGDEPAVDDPINNTYDMLEATVDDPPGAMDGGTVVMPQDLDAKLASMIAASTPPAPSTPGPSQLNNTVAMIPDAASLSAAIERAAQRRSSASGDRISSWPPSMPQSAQPYSVGPHSGPHHSQPVAVAPPRAPTAPMQMGVVQPSPYPSGEHPSHSGERPSLSGDVSRSSLGPAPPPRRSQRRSSLGWWLLLLVLLGVGVGVYLWAPWQSAARSLPHGWMRA